MSVYDLRTEKHVLGGIIKSPSCFADLERFISEKDFYSEVHSTIFSIMKTMLLNGEEVDKTVLALRIKNLGISFKDEINIHDYIDSISFTQITQKATIEAAQELAKLRIVREIVESCKETATWAKKNMDKPLDDIVSGSDAIFNEQMRSYEFDDEPENLFDDIENLIEERGNNPQEDYGFITPYSEWNRLYGGFRVGNIYAIASRPGQGKTTWLNYTAYRAAELNDTKVLILDTEMSPQEMKFRMVAAMSKVSVWHLETGNWRKNPDMIEKVRSALKVLKEKEYSFMHVGNKSTDQVCSLIRRWHLNKVGRANKCIIVYDYLKLTGDKVGNNWAEHQVLGEKVDKLKKISEECNAALLTAIQMNRSGENFNRNSGSVVYDSSAIAQSDRLQWFASFVGLFCRKTLDEIAMDNVYDDNGVLLHDFGTHKLVPLKTRFQGKDAAGHHDIIRRPDPNGNGPGTWSNNYLSFNVDNFEVEETGSLANIVDRQNNVFDLDDRRENDGERL
jgi:replicative DNA helicase